METLNHSGALLYYALAITTYRPEDTSGTFILKDVGSSSPCKPIIDIRGSERAVLIPALIMLVASLRARNGHSRWYTYLPCLSCLRSLAVIALRKPVLRRRGFVGYDLFL